MRLERLLTLQSARTGYRESLLGTRVRLDFWHDRLIVIELKTLLPVIARIINTRGVERTKQSSMEQHTLPHSIALPLSH